MLPLECRFRLKIRRRKEQKVRAGTRRAWRPHCTAVTISTEPFSAYAVFQDTIGRSPWWPLSWYHVHQY